MIKIDRSIPIPKNVGKWGAPKYPFEEMKAPKGKKASSFFVKAKDTHSLQISLLACFNAYCKRRGLKWKASTKKFKNGVRIWRTK